MPTADEMNQRTHIAIRPAHAWPCRCRLAREMARIAGALPGWGVFELTQGPPWEAMLSNGEDHEHGFGDSMMAALDWAVQSAVRNELVKDEAEIADYRARTRVGSAQEAILRVRARTTERLGSRLVDR